MTAHELDGIVWRKSSFTGNGNCVEVGWRKSSYTATENCVEVSWPAEVGVAVRDSKQQTGPTLAFSTSAWRTFLRNRV